MRVANLALCTTLISMLIKNIIIQEYNSLKTSPMLLIGHLHTQRLFLIGCLLSHLLFPTRILTRICPLPVLISLALYIYAILSSYLKAMVSDKYHSYLGTFPILVHLPIMGCLLFQSSRALTQSPILAISFPFLYIPPLLSMLGGLFLLPIIIS